MRLIRDKNFLTNHYFSRVIITNNIKKIESIRGQIIIERIMDNKQGEKQQQQEQQQEQQKQ